MARHKQMSPTVHNEMTPLTWNNKKKKKNQTMTNAYHKNQHLLKKKTLKIVHRNNKF